MWKLQGIKVNMIMTDYCMPGMSGYDLLRRVKVKTNLRQTPKFPRLFCLSEYLMYVKCTFLTDSLKKMPIAKHSLPHESATRSSACRSRNIYNDVQYSFSPSISFHLNGFVFYNLKPCSAKVYEQP